MGATRSFLSGLAFLALLSGLPGQAPEAGAEPAWIVPEGLEVQTFAESPMLYNPTAMDVDERGRIWVAEGVNYRTWRGRNPGRRHPDGDRILILEDRDGDGRADEVKVFAQDKDLVAPLGICVLDEGVLVSCSPAAYLYIDDDGDDVADRREVFLEGFGGHDHDHGLHSFVLGPDGRLLFNAGNAGPHLVTDRAGWRLRSGSVYVGGGAQTADNTPGLVSDDGRAWTGGLVMRVGRDGRGLRVLAHNFRNPYEVAIDAFGDQWIADNDDDGNEGCRTLWVMEGSNNGYFSADGKRYWRSDQRPGQNRQRAHWHQDDPGVAPAGCLNGNGGPTGVAVYEDGPMRDRFEGVVLNCDAGRGVVFAHRPKAAGAGFELESGALIRMAEKKGSQKRWFRPSDVCVGTDGAIYVSDWYDPGVGGHLARDRAAYGRILRIAPPGLAAGLPVPLKTMEDEVAALSSPAVNIRGRAAHRLAQRGSAALESLTRIIAASDDVRLRARALWIAAGLGETGRLVASARLADPDPRMRLTAFRALRRHLPADELVAYQLTNATDVDPAIRREVALSLRDMGETKSLLITDLLISRYTPGDRFMLEAIGTAAEGVESAVAAEMQLDRVEGAKEWTRTQADLAWRLHLPESVSAMEARAGHAALSREARLQMIDGLAFVPDKAAAEAMSRLALAGPEDTRGRARWWLKHRLTNDWREFGIRLPTVSADRKGARKLWSSGLVKRGVHAFDLDLTGAESLWFVVTDGTNGNGCDWADWIAPRIEAAEGGESLDLCALPWAAAEAAWGSVNVDKNCVGRALRIGGKEIPRGIGTHAKSEIVWHLPKMEGPLRLKGAVGPDDGGTTQSHAATEIEFEIWVKAPPNLGWIAASRKRLLDEAVSLAERRDEVKKLASHAKGGLVLLQLGATEAFPADLKEAAGRALSRNPDLSIRALASARFPRVVHGGPALPPLETLAEMKGDPTRGAAVFFGETARCSTCHRLEGRGGDIGPELTKIREKYDRRALLDAILNPSAAISFGYETWLIGTEDGDIFSGFILAEGDTLILKDTAGERHAIPADSIAWRRRESSSTMPDDVGLGLGARDLADLVAFLEEDRSQPLRRGETRRLFNGRDLGGWTFQPAANSGKIDEVWGVTSEGTLTCSGHPIGYLRTEARYTNFVLELEWRFAAGGKPGNSGVLLRVQEPDKVWPNSIEAQLHHRNAGDIWNIGNFPMKVAVDRTSGRRTKKARPCNEKPLGEWNRYRIILSRGDLKLEVNDEVQNTATWCRELPGYIALQSEGAAIEFRNIRLTPLTR